MDKVIKVFRMNEYEFWAGPSLEVCKKKYLEITGVAEEEAFDEPYELANEQMDTFLYVEDDGSKKTFAKKLQELIDSGFNFPDLFAVSEN